VIAEEAEAVQAIRRATPADVPALARVINRAYQVEEFFIHGPRIDEPSLQRRFANANASFLVIDDNEEPGRLAGAVYTELRGKRGYFGLLSVDPDRQKRGLGKKLVLAVEANCRVAGCTHLDLDTVNVRLELPSFYSALGFAPGATAPFPEADKLKSPAHLVLWSKSL
jgi:N-acetylglutamate synthase-like GNAT family acetyltransferase